MKIYGIQLDIVWENKQTNFEKVRSLLSLTNPEPDSLVLLPEMFATGFSMNKEEISRDEPQFTESFLQETARQYRIYLLGGMVTMNASGLGSNLAVVCDPTGKTIAAYQKLHPFTYGGESKHYELGREIICFSWQGFTVAPFICYDLRFPEIFRHAVQRGANLIPVIACFPQARELHWMALLRARAIENQLYIAGVNRCGSDPKLAYSGRSMIIDPKGEILADAGNGESVIGAEVSLSDLNTYRQELPFLLDIRKEYRML
ncbi:MAG: carbon-nitrogen family hydrolase [bacterium]|jgi:omega-amidase